MEILKKDLNKVEIETETDKCSENFDFKLTQEDEVDIKIDNILNDYNLIKAFTAKIEKSKLTYKEQSIHELLTDYTDIIYNDMKELAKINIIQHIIHLLNSTLIAQKCHSIN